MSAGSGRELNSGGKTKKVKQKLIWKSVPPGFGDFKQGEEVTIENFKEIKEMKDELMKSASGEKKMKIEKNYNQVLDLANIEKETSKTLKEGTWSTLGMLINALEKVHGQDCINVFVVGAIKQENPNEKDKGGYAILGGRPPKQLGKPMPDIIPGRGIVIEDKYALEGQKGLILAHEFGHNLGLRHEDPWVDEGNLMYPTVTKSKLAKEQCNSKDKARACALEIQKLRTK